jgi:hypothetical protein
MKDNEDVKEMVIAKNFQKGLYIGTLKYEPVVTGYGLDSRGAGF